ncbi:MAG: hypothetical protein ACEY3L_09650 [Wolbachia sp.]
MLLYPTQVYSSRENRLDLLRNPVISARDAGTYSQKFTYNSISNKFVIPLLVSGIYAEIPRRYDVGLLSFRYVLAGSMPRYRE